MNIRCRLQNCDGDNIKKFTATLISEKGNTCDRKNGINGKCVLETNPVSTDNFRMIYAPITNYTIDYHLVIEGDTSITKRENVAVTAKDLTIGYVDVISTIGEIR